MKPPLGIMSRYRWEEKRMYDLAEVIKRYMAHGKVIPQEWVNEYNEIAERISTLFKEDSQ